MKVAVITGASSGIGKEFALQIDAIFSNLDEIWLVARNKERLQALADSLRTRCRIFAVDITNGMQVSRLERAAKKDHVTVCMLVNCAGYGVSGEFLRGERKEECGMVRLNCEALTNLTHLFLPFMRPNSRIIQIASAAAFLPQESFAVYAASKAYVYSFSRALGMELLRRKIYVTAVCPGPVNTPFFEISEKGAPLKPLKKKFMADPKDVVAMALWDSYHKKPVSVYGGSMKLLRVIVKLFPHTFLLRIWHFL